MLADRPDGTVVGLGDVVAKAHPPGPPADTGELTVRLHIAAHPLLAGIMLAPLTPAGTPLPGAAPAPGGTPTGGAAGTYPADPLRPMRLHDGRPATLWPRGRPVDPDAPDSAPWEAAGTLLARLHSVRLDALRAGLPGPIPAMRGPEKAARALKRMRAALDHDHGHDPAATATATDSAPASELTAAVEAVEAAWAVLPAWCRGEEPPEPSRLSALCHGDFHMGQLVSHPAGEDGAWQLIDVDDSGIGDPAWDLARPAAWFATGLLPGPSWQRFLHAYETAAATPFLGGGDGTWPPRLDAPARALTVQTAALAVAKAHAARRPLDEAETACAEACERIATAHVPGQRDETGRTLDPQ
ncbi:phosphotransferase [Streptomyces sp. HNM0575]|nr:phosphotransferase [Streptomyces sp. HNM0575]